MVKKTVKITKKKRRSSLINILLHNNTQLYAYIPLMVKKRIDLLKKSNYTHKNLFKTLANFEFSLKKII